VWLPPEWGPGQIGTDTEDEGAELDNIIGWDLETLTESVEPSVILLGDEGAQLRRDDGVFEALKVRGERGQI
jgi:hypothetical protein